MYFTLELRVFEYVIVAIRYIRLLMMWELSRRRRQDQGKLKKDPVNALRDMRIVRSRVVLQPYQGTPSRVSTCSS